MTEETRFFPVIDGGSYMERDIMISPIIYLKHAEVISKKFQAGTMQVTII